MSTDKPKNTDAVPELKDVEAGSDADTTPTPEIGKTPPNPNKPKPQAGKQ